MKLLFWIVVAILAVCLALFAVSNREAVSLGLWPLSNVVDLPLYLAILAAVLIGFILGALAAWIGSWGPRREVCRRGRRIAALERELAATHARLPGTVSSPSTSLAVR
ncbi:MAG TPA: LapA family protein [Stellaceae bacterium]|jgi:uncharacterized integral membrane protein|nr:LapA family protein [Stellaceae bacterium]